MKVVKLLGYQQWSGNDGVMMRTNDLILQVNEEEKEVKFYQKDTEPIPKEGDEFSDEWELKGKTDKKGNPFIFKKEKEFQKNYQKRSQSQIIHDQHRTSFCIPCCYGGAYTKNK